MFFVPLFCIMVSLSDEFSGCFFLTDRPIASIAFHAKGEIIAVASGHKVLFFLPCFYIL